MSAGRQPPHRLRVQIIAVARLGNDPRIAAFAIDSPQPGATTAGAGIEVSGWVIGHPAPVAGVRVVSDRGAGPAFPLDVARPDVGGDYPAFAHAAASGFLFWAPLAPDPGESSLTVQAMLADGAAVTLATIRLRIAPVAIEPAVGFRAVGGPDFLIIGTQRGGTTSLHAYLSAHPHVTLPTTKEIHYLTDRYQRGEEWYRGQFPTMLPSNHLTGEATPYALFHPLAPMRLRRIARDAKLIVLLRNPVDRAYSHYLMERQRGDEPLDFTAALDAEPARLAGEDARILADSAYVSHAHKHFSYLARGDYAPQLQRWLDLFPRDQVLILRSEDLYARTAETFAAVTTFLGLPAADDIPFAVHNRQAGPPLPEATRDRLVAHFAPRNAALAEILGWDPDWD